MYIIDGIRTPIGNFGGSLRSYSAVDLGIILIKEIVKRKKLKNDSANGVALVKKV